MAVTWAAPGRVNLIGEHVDYNDGLVLPFALPLTTTARVRRTTTGRATARSSWLGGEQPVTFDLPPRQCDVHGWAAYVAGVVWALAAGPDRSGEGDVGLDIDIGGQLPVGAGLSSSAALTCAVACAVDEALGLRLDRPALAMAAVRAENGYVGVPTGTMDQLAAMLCTPGHALLLDCRSGHTEQIPLDLDAAGLRLLVVDTHTRRDLTSSAYAERRAECGAAAAELGLGSLRDATLATVRGIGDARQRRRAHHVVSEIERVAQVADILRAGHQADIGAFLTASHESLRDDYEVSSDRLDATVEAALAAGALGARMTGAGFGGCAITLCRAPDVGQILDAVETAYARNGWPAPACWAGTASAGAHRVI